MGYSGIVFFLLVLVAENIRNTEAACVHVNNNDMVEYSCTGGYPSDLSVLPDNVEKIRISRMSIPSVTHDTFSRFGNSLWVLSCSNCGIEKIEPGAFQDLRNLQQLSLDGNHFTTIKGSWVQGLDFLTYLDINYNRISSIDDDVFENLPSLVDLRMSGNRLECVSLRALSNLSELKRIFLGENPNFKCPNAISKFLENRGISFERDPEWSRLQTDQIGVEIPVEEMREWRTLPPPVYHQTAPPPHTDRYYTSTTTVRPTEDQRRPYSPPSYPTYAPVYPITESPVVYNTRPAWPPIPETTHRPTFPSVQLPPGLPQELPSNWPFPPQEQPTRQPNYPPIEPVTYPEERPIYPEERPAYPEERPSYPEERPPYQEERPSYPGGRPVYPEERPTYPEERPTYPEERPTYPEERPTYPVERPTYPEERPTYPVATLPIYIDPRYDVGSSGVQNPANSDGSTYKDTRYEDPAYPNQYGQPTYPSGGTRTPSLATRPNEQNPNILEENFSENEYPPGSYPSHTSGSAHVVGPYLSPEPTTFKAGIVQAPTERPNLQNYTLIIPLQTTDKPVPTCAPNAGSSILLQFKLFFVLLLLVTKSQF